MTEQSAIDSLIALADTMDSQERIGAAIYLNELWLRVLETDTSVTADELEKLLEEMKLHYPEVAYLFEPVQ